MQANAERRDSGRLHPPRQELLQEAEPRGGGRRAFRYRLCGDNRFIPLYGEFFDHITDPDHDQTTDGAYSYLDISTYPFMSLTRADDDPQDNDGLFTI